MEYEQERGIRAPGVRPGGTFTVTANKTVAVPVDRLFSAFTDAELRASARDERTSPCPTIPGALG